MILRAVALCVIALTIAACTQTMSDTDVPALSSGGRFDLEKADILTESIGLVYGTDPQPDWYPAFEHLTVKLGGARVYTTLTEADAALAETMCRDIASITYDDDAEPIGVTDVYIFGVENVDLADCGVVLL